MNNISTCESRRRNLLFFRHEIRNSLTGIVGYAEDLLETFGDAPRELVLELEELKRIGRTMLGDLNERIDPDTLAGIEAADVQRAVDSFLTMSLGPAAAVDAACSRAIAAAGRARAYGAIPTICRIQAAGVMLHQILTTQTPFTSSKTAPPEPRSASSLGTDGASKRAEALPGARLLVADDNSISRDLLCRLLVRQGYVVDQTDSGRRALELARTGHYDLVLLDLVFPDLDGLSILCALEREGRLGLAPIVVVSASDDADSVARCLEHGADDYLFKPFHGVLIEARIRACLELKRAKQRESVYLSALEKYRSDGASSAPR
jgi:CheY-like chemotaxis protein